MLPASGSADTQTRERDTGMPQNAFVADNVVVFGALDDLLRRRFSTENLTAYGPPQGKSLSTRFMILSGRIAEWRDWWTVLKDSFRGQDIEMSVQDYKGNIWLTTLSPTSPGRGVSAIETIHTDPPDLVEALLDLHSCQRVAQEDEAAPPESEVLRSAERVLRTMYGTAPRPYAVYPMPEGEVAIDAHTPPGTKVVVICGTDGTARCLVYINEEFHRREYEELSAIPDIFIKEALRKADAAAAQ